MARYGNPDAIDWKALHESAVEVIATDVDREIATEPDICVDCGKPLPHTLLTCLPPLRLRRDRN